MITLSERSHFAEPHLPPWEQGAWAFFGADGSRADAIKELRRLLNPNGPLGYVCLVGPYKVGKTSVLNYVLSETPQARCV